MRIFRTNPGKVAFVFLLVALVAGLLIFSKKRDVGKVKGKLSLVDSIPKGYKMLPFEDSSEGRLAAYGKALVNRTHDLLGPGSKIHLTNNRLSCTNCHLNGGTKPYAAPFVGLAKVFPTYIGRENKVESLEERINGCMERSMNGRAMDPDCLEMRAMVSYIGHLSKGYSPKIRAKGQGFMTIQVPDRAAEPARGLLVYRKHCISCHGLNGQGGKGRPGVRDGEYRYPPLWGKDSYNDGAGMARLLTAARFIKANMPYGTDYLSPTLSDEDAYDVAAFVNSHSRPSKANKEKDYPDLKKKPKDCPYPPYADQLSQHQHQLGPF